MALQTLYIQNFRNLASGNLSLHEKMNFLVGDNGSGKSSCLEAIFYLGHIKSFRTTKTENLVNFEQSTFVLSALDETDKRFGLSRELNTGNIELKVNTQKVSKLSEFAKCLAVQIITPESFKLFSGGAKERRKFVDLGLFHVEHSFSKLWVQFNKALKQRNACLKKHSAWEQEVYWREEFCSLSEKVAELRRVYIDALKEELQQWLEILMPEVVSDIGVSYLQGWNSKKALADVLSENIEKERERTYSLFGAHKFDVRFTYKRSAIEASLSRGQQKLFLLALTFAQTKLIARVNSVKPILLVDDIGAELDSHSRSAFQHAIRDLDCQVVVSAIDEKSLEPIIPEDNNYKMFHVEHGKISEKSK